MLKGPTSTRLASLSDFFLVPSSSFFSLTRAFLSRNVVCVWKGTYGGVGMGKRWGQRGYLVFSESLHLLDENKPIQGNPNQNISQTLELGSATQVSHLCAPPISPKVFWALVNDER